MRAETAFLRWIERLEQLFEAETTALRGGGAIDFESFNAKKNHALLEFMIVSRNMPDNVPDAAAAGLARLRAKLVKNAEMLEQHLRATSEISNVMIKTIQAEQSDGTYSGKSILRR